ncbi:TPA: MetQ/NlpA family ABC transporter substrate-binding protein [Streptococcus suis]|jgi:D-methionine transport system substrate-binding protein|uniref:MetQ/NlpA family ABC transporter substrate-binding protein n=1 Tax=Streptococcus parasuis TaxID=1501662 RepID=UPI002AA4813E|nr:MetQ/NlpA family ABC transporter substrate-binding protein [Streptococcus suis]HEM3618459.1 MetQ/NlpA family ABC transporter substrate-binding protein [Streptococcus suis]HEM3638695.1 MetQ/NlpA family ABC transporter substrate-binding protein [Streptococcus suis]HEM3654050.1 MetQ/NlpA family ABC transporter substrate-binding protein [Streptococcus suis]HEM3671888.1 MetQ/NlpA family ABC transporter substrate-binding protein [Streptococcus suis]
MKLKKLFTLAAAALSVGVLAACGSSSSSSSSDSSATTVRVGVMSLSDSEQARWDKVQEILDDEVKLEFTQFTDYSQPNKAVAENEVDINAFQHYNFLNNWNQENGEDLVAIADTYIAPIRLYSGTADGKNKYTKVEEIPDGAEIAVPNDPTNESRALYLLQTAGLIKVGVSGTELATIADITENKKNLKITELDASQTASSLSSVDAAVVNNTFVLEAGLDYKNALYKEQKDENSKQWYNLIAARSDWEKSEQAASIKKIIEAYQTDEVKKVIEETSDGMDEPVW